MSCNKCKKQQQMDFIDREISKVEKPMIIGIVVVGLLTLYGLSQLFLKILSLF